MMWSRKFCCMLLLLLHEFVMPYPVNNDVIQFYESLTVEERRWFYQYHLAKALARKLITRQFAKLNQEYSSVSPDIPEEYLKKFEEIDRNISPDLPSAIYDWMVDQYHVTDQDISTFMTARSCIVCNKAGQCFDPCDNSIFCC